MKEVPGRPRTSCRTGAGNSASQGLWGEGYPPCTAPGVRVPLSCALLSLHILHRAPAWSRSKTRMSPIPQGSVSLGLQPCLKFHHYKPAFGWSLHRHPGITFTVNTGKRKKPQECSLTSVSGSKYWTARTWILKKLVLPRRQPQKASHLQATFTALPSATWGLSA